MRRSDLEAVSAIVSELQPVVHDLAKRLREIDDERHRKAALVVIISTLLKLSLNYAGDMFGVLETAKFSIFYDLQSLVNAIWGGEGSEVLQNS